MYLPILGLESQNQRSRNENEHKYNKTVIPFVLMGR